MEDPKHKKDATMPHHQHVARLYSEYARISVLKTVLISGFAVFGFLMIWTITRILSMYATALAVLLYFAMDRIVLAVIDSEIQKKKFQSKSHLKRVVFFVVLSILISRTICTPLFDGQTKRRHIFEQICTVLRYTTIPCFGTYVFGIPFLPSTFGCTMRASAFPLLRNPYQLFFSPLYATSLVGLPDDAKITLFRRYERPPLAFSLTRTIVMALVSGMVLGTMYNWSDPAIWIVWTICMFVELLMSSTLSEINPFSVSRFPWEAAFDIFAFLQRTAVYVLLCVIFLPGLEGIFIYLVVFVGNAVARAMIEKDILDHLIEPICLMGSNMSMSEQAHLIHCCILEDMQLADTASILPAKTEEPQGSLKFEQDLYTSISEQYEYALSHPSKLTENELACDLMKLAALKVVAQADSIFDDGTMPPQILRSVCVLLGCLGRTLSKCQKSAEGKYWVQWHLPPAFFFAVRYGLKGLRLHLSKDKQSFDFIVFSRVSLDAIRLLVEGIEDFKLHDSTATLYLDDIKDLCKATEEDIIQAANAFGATGIRIDAYQDRMLKA